MSLEDILERAGIDPGTMTPLFPSERRAGWRAVTPGAHAIDAWKLLRVAVDESRHWPVLLGDDEGLSRVVGDSERHLSGRSIDDGLKVADTIDAALLLAERRAEQEEYGEPPRGPWPEDPGPIEFTIPFDILSKKPHPHVHVALVSTTVPWQVPAHLGIGGWNECPGPEEHAAVFRQWHRDYGAEVVGISGDTIEMTVGRPPQDRDAALKLAFDQYAYCADLVDQGTQTIDNLAAALLKSRVWYFWWD
jgi:hypothetical protein